MDVRTACALRERGDSFVQFSRNGRWGTCVDCPRDRELHAFPEFCPFTDRYDHQLTAKELAENFEIIREVRP